MHIDYELTEEQSMLRTMVREFVNAEIKPIARKIDEEERIPRELIQKLADLGLLGAAFPTEYGGGGFGEVGYCLMQEEIARGCLSTATFVGAHQSIGSNAIYLGGTEALKKKYLVPLAEGKLIGGFALTETLAGSDSFNLRTRAHLDGDEWVINGEKLWITNGGLADILSVFARTERGITGFVVETKSPGFSAGPPEHKMGIRGSMTNAITFDNVRVPKENVLGEEGRGFIVAMRTLDAGRLGLGAACLARRRKCWKCPRGTRRNGSSSTFPFRTSRPSSSCSRTWQRRSSRWSRWSTGRPATTTRRRAFPGRLHM